MFFKYDDKSVRLFGRWNNDDVLNSAVTVNPGAKFEFAFKGEMAVMHFNMEWRVEPALHLWISVDGGAKIETPIDSYLRVCAENDKEHIVTVIFKSSMEMQHRWNRPLESKVAFMGYEADGDGTLPENNKKTIELVGDSITEGVLIDEPYKPLLPEWKCRPYQDDSTATYGYLTAMALDLEPICMGFGAVGILKGGCGNVPKVIESYPYCYENAPISHKSADYILINHGANDRHQPAEDYIKGYEELLKLIRKMNPNSQIISLSPFCGAFYKELGEMIEKYNKENNDDVFYIDSHGWIPEEPLHPLRDGHKIVAENLTKILKNKFSL